MYVIAAQRLFVKGMHGPTLTLCYVRIAILITELLVIRVRCLCVCSTPTPVALQFAPAQYKRRRDLFCICNRAATCIIGLLVLHAVH